MKSKESNLRFLVDNIQDLLEEVYGKLFPERASTFLVPHQPEHGRGSLLIRQDDYDTLQIGLSICPSICRTVYKCDPIESLNSTNLDAFWVIAEEVSHLFLLLTRANKSEKVSRLELEWQAEVDKILVAALLKQAQAGASMVRILVHKLFVESQIFDSSTHYSTADLYAGKFWYALIRSGLGREFDFNRQFKQFLEREYSKPLSLKFPFSQTRIAI